MPLSTQIIRNGEQLKLRWGNFHVAAMALASGFDAKQAPLSGPEVIYEGHDVLSDWDCYPDMPFPITGRLAFNLCSYPLLAKTPLNETQYTLRDRHKFIDMMDGEVLHLLPGDELYAWR